MLVSDFQYDLPPERIPPAAPEPAAWELAGSEVSRIPRLAAARRPPGREQYPRVPSPALRPPQRTARPAPQPAQSGRTRLSPRPHRGSADTPGGGRSDGVGVLRGWARCP